MRGFPSLWARLRSIFTNFVRTSIFFRINSNSFDFQSGGDYTPMSNKSIEFKYMRTEGIQEKPEEENKATPMKGVYYQEEKTGDMSDRLQILPSDITDCNKNLFAKKSDDNKAIYHELEMAQQTQVISRNF